jgi:hypothetical protein
MDDFETLVRRRRTRPDETERMTLAVQTAVSLVDGCDHAGVTVVDELSVTTRVATDDLIARGDRLQSEFGEGPCLDAVRHHDVVISQHLGSDRRWPRWAPLASQELGITSIVSLLLYAHGHSYATLNLYGERTGGFSSGDLATAHTLAAHLANLVEAGLPGDEAVRGAARGSTVIGQAEGLLMAWLDIDEHQAFSYLRRLALRSNQELSVIAGEMVRTRVPPLR